MTVQKKPEDLLDQQREHFNSISGRYMEARKTPNHLLLKDLLWANMLSDMKEFKARQIDVLEPMCGSCDGLEIVKRHISPNVIYAGFDYSDNMVDALKKAKPDLNVWQADATTFQPPSDAYDVIILIGGLHHVPDHAAGVVKLLAKSLKPGGIFINFEPTFGNYVFKKIREKIYNKNTLFDAQTERSFAVDELIGMFKSSNLRARKIRFPGLLSYVLYYNPDAFPSLNIGGGTLVRILFYIDKLLYASWIGRKLSFATLSIWQRANDESPAT
jgi:SAM-dependent methyltransferase